MILDELQLWWGSFMTKEAGLSDTQLYKQAGNAVTVDVVEQIGKRLVLEDDETMIAYVLEKHYDSI